MSCQIVILAAGNGSRMASDLPKVLHKVGGISMISRVLANARAVTDDVILVHSPRLLKYLPLDQNIYKLVEQSQPLGTADAVNTAMPWINHHQITLVIFGDNPFISPVIINQLLARTSQKNEAIITLSFERNDPEQYGRIVIDKAGNFLKIVEFKNATDQQKKITLCNSGIMSFGPGILHKYLPKYVAQASSQSSEVYLGGLVEICRQHQEKVGYLLSSDHHAVIGVNTQAELVAANNIEATLLTILPLDQ